MTLVEGLRRHWPEYAIEAALLAAFMLSASVFGTLLEYPGSPIHQALPDPATRRGIMGAAMGLTAVGLVYSPWGSRSGAHFNPAVTLTFYRLGKIARVDAIWYVVAQFAGGIGGMVVAMQLIHRPLADPAVSYVVTRPGPRGPGVAFVAEVVISFLLMLTVLSVSNARRLAHWTGICVGILVATYIFVEAPLSGMSMNPARTLGSAFAAWNWTSLWVYFTAPPLGMLTAVAAYRRRPVFCAKLYHPEGPRCIFCEYRERRAAHARTPLPPRELSQSHPH